MASSTSLKELSKAINAFILEPVLPLPDDLVETIAAYLRRHQKYDETSSDRLQEELILIFDKHVRRNPTTFGAWLGILRRLLPVLQTPERILVWFDSCRNMFDNNSVDKNFVNETMAGLMDTVTLADEYQDTSDTDGAPNPIIDRLLAEWMDKYYPAYSEGNTALEYNERMLRDALCNFGKKRPQAFFASLDRYFVRKQYRKFTLRFFCDFIQSQPPHLHQIMHTPLFLNLLKCLQQDTSTTVISAALTALIMLLPHMPSSLVPHLPTLFNIYARLLFWDCERSLVPASHDSDQTSRWDICVFDPEADELSISHLPNYYTILYGLYPINFMDYTRKPQRYMRHAKASNPDEIEVQPTEIRHRSERFRRHHLLHPNFYTLTIDSEKTDFSRWIKSEAAEVVAECMSLYLSPETQILAGPDLPSIPIATAPAMIEESDRVKSDPAFLSGSLSKVNSWRNTHFSCADSISSGHAPSTMMRHGSQSSLPSNRDSSEVRVREYGIESPTLQAQLPQNSSHTQLQDMIKSNKAIKSSLNQSLANESVPSLALSHQESVTDRHMGHQSMPPLPHATSPAASMAEGASPAAHLQRQILLLQNDLSFERYLKQQHMAHIGDLRRRQMSEAATEAETQNLILMNRSLKNRYEEAKMGEVKVRKESEKSRALAKKWEADLSNKLKNLRDESKKTHAEFETIRRELEESRRENDKLVKLVCDAEVKELNARQNMQSIEIHGAEIDRLRAEVERLTISERDYQAKEVERQTAVNSAVEAASQMEGLRMRLTAQEVEVQRTRNLFQSQVEALQEQLSEAQEEHGRPGVKTNIMVESALAASRAKQAELQKQYGLLMRKYTVLQSSLLDMQSEASPPHHRSEQGMTIEGNSENPALSGSPVLMKAKSHRVLSEGHEATSFNVTPPLGANPVPPISAALQSQRSTSPSGVEGSGPGALSMSPDQRYFSSGLQSRIRRESKDKPKEDASSSSKPKKEKRTTGLRGIRGFVNN